MVKTREKEEWQCGGFRWFCQPMLAAKGLREGYVVSLLVRVIAV
jgi:hypothetical protein